MGAVRGVMLSALIVLIGAGSLWPPRGNWGLSRVGQRCEDALLELRFPFLSVSEAAGRSVLKVLIPPYEPRLGRHLVFARGRDTRLWVDGRAIVSLLHPAPNQLVWSSRQKLWLGGAPGERGLPVRIRRLALFDRALKSEEVRALYQGGPAKEPWDRHAAPALVLRPSEGLPGGSMRSAGRAGEVTMLMPQDAVRDERGLWLVGTPAVSAEALSELASLVRRRQAISVELWLELPEPHPDRREPVLALAASQEQTNLRIELARSYAQVNVRAAYPSRRRMLDLVFNVAAYIPLGLLLAWGRGSRGVVASALFVGAGLSVLIEALQLLSPDRTPSIVDLMANGTGAFLGALLATTLTARAGGR
jgi:VanZ family protein